MRTSLCCGVRTLILLSATGLDTQVTQFRMHFGKSCGLDRELKVGSPGRIRTSDQPVNSRLLYH